jgi:hypothetical protein
MSPLIAVLDVESLVAIVVPIGAVFIVAMTAIVTTHYRKLRHDDMEATLKMEMVQRGVAAEEIERVLAARMGGPSRHGRRGQPPLQQQPQQPQQQQGAQAAGH